MGPYINSELMEAMCDGKLDAFDKNEICNNIKLMKAIYEGKISTINKYINHVDLTYIEDGETFVTASLSNSDVYLAQRFLKKDSTLLNHQNNDGETALIILCKHDDGNGIEGRIEVIKLLLELKCNVITKDFDGNTAMHYAIQKNDTEILALFDEHFYMITDE